nr:MAG: hypothetical protein H1Bulk305_000011 [Cystoviridae sp.]
MTTLDEWEIFEQSVSGQRHSNFDDDEPTSEICAIAGCQNRADFSLWVTLRGHHRTKRYCIEHYGDQSMLEVGYQLGL